MVSARAVYFTLSLWLVTVATAGTVSVEHGREALRMDGLPAMTIEEFEAAFDARTAP